ncbi:MAG: type VI secretion system baseplate subunit TssE [Paracraurococcus sp.]
MQASAAGLPLFDRLAAAAPPAGLRASVQRELEALLNTRLPLTLDEAAALPAGVLTYGLPDLSAFPMGQEAARVRLARYLEAAVAVFEPRLAGPRVEVVVDSGPDAMLVVVSGRLGDGPVDVRARIARPLAGTRDAA